jgi:hypothetical protein
VIDLSSDVVEAWVVPSDPENRHSWRKLHTVRACGSDDGGRYRLHSWRHLTEAEELIAESLEQP